MVFQNDRETVSTTLSIHVLTSLESVIAKSVLELDLFCRLRLSLLKNIGDRDRPLLEVLDMYGLRNGL